MHIARWVSLVAGVHGIVACQPRPAADSGAGAMRAFESRIYRVANPGTTRSMERR